MRKRMYAAAIALGAIAFGSSAYADTWSGAYGNTIVSTYDDGHVVDVYVEPDHTYTIVPRDGGETISGTWSDNSGESCFTITAPAKDAGGAPLCFAIKEYKVGDTFDGKDSTGHFNAEIVKGRK